jgi:hypothetical protein
MVVKSTVVQDVKLIQIAVMEVSSRGSVVCASGI